MPGIVKLSADETASPCRERRGVGPFLGLRWWSFRLLQWTLRPLDECPNFGRWSSHQLTMKILDVPQSGSSAGTTSSRNRYGQYRRTRAVPVNVNSTAQQAARTNLSDMSAAWRGLTDVQRAAWASWADANPRVDSLGQSVTLSGHQAFVGVNSALLNSGQATVDTPSSAAPPDAPTRGTTTITAAGLSIVFGANPVPADMALVIESSPPMSAGRKFNGDFRVVKVRAAAAASTLLKADMEAKYGTLAADQKFFVRARYVAEDGTVSAFETYDFVLT